jgi:hypothetical protein
MVKKRGIKQKRATKSAARRASPHGRIEVILRRKEFGKAPVEKHFVLQDGRRIASLFQLIDELETMSEEGYRKFVNEWKNDFATWVKDVFEVPSLADELQRVRDRIGTQRAIMKHLLNEVAHLASKQHREDVKQHVEQERKSKAVKLVIREP